MAIWCKSKTVLFLIFFPFFRSVLTEELRNCGGIPGRSKGWGIVEFKSPEEVSENSPSNKRCTFFLEKFSSDLKSNSPVLRGSSGFVGADEPGLIFGWGGCRR